MKIYCILKNIKIKNYNKTQPNKSELITLLKNKTTKKRGYK